MIHLLQVQLSQQRRRRDQNIHHWDNGSQWAWPQRASKPEVGVFPIPDTVRRQDAANGWGHGGNSGALMGALLLIGLAF